MSNQKQKIKWFKGRDISKIIDEVAQDLSIPHDVVDYIVRKQWEIFRLEMRSLNSSGIYVKNLGRFLIKTGKKSYREQVLTLVRQIREFRKMKESNSGIIYNPEFTSEESLINEFRNLWEKRKLIQDRERFLKIKKQNKNNDTNSIREVHKIQ